MNNDMPEDQQAILPDAEDEYASPKLLVNGTFNLWSHRYL